MINRYINITYLGIGICLGIVSILYTEILKEPAITMPAETTSSVTKTRISVVDNISSDCEPALQSTASRDSVGNDQQPQSVPIRTLEAILEHGLTSEERDWLSEHQTHYAINELEKKHWLVEDITEKVTTLENTSTRRYLVDALHGLNSHLRESAIFRLAESQREIDHITASELLKNTKNKALQQDILETLLSEDENSLLIKSIAQELGDTIHEPHLEDSLSRLYEIYRTTTKPDIKSEIIESITPESTLQDQSFYEILSMLENDTKVGELERSENIRSWVSSHLNSFTESQLNAIELYSSNIFQNSKNIKIKKVSILIDQELNEAKTY